MTTKEVAQICGVTDRTVSGNAKKAGVLLENGKSHDWTEEELKRLQLVLMTNAQNNNANASEVVKETSKTVFQLGTLADVILENEVTLMGKTFNVYGTVEEPLFRAKDVADWIEHSNVSAMVQSVDDDEKLTINISYSEVRKHDEIFLTENGVYEVLMLSRKPIAKEFKKEVKKMLHTLRTKKATLMPTNFADALEAYAKEVRAREEAQQALFAETQQKLLALEQKEQAEANYNAEKQEHQKDKELVTHKYLTATQIKETILKEYGKKIVVSKAVKRIPLDDNDILYKPFKNGDFTGQQPVYHPNVLDKIREILG